jgi:hypothetical protein
LTVFDERPSSSGRERAWVPANDPVREDGKITVEGDTLGDCAPSCLGSALNWKSS